MKMLDGDIVLITGGGSGLGLGLAHYCIREGAEVAVLEIVPEKVAKISEELGESALVIQGDATSPDDLNRLRAAIEERWGRLNAIICAHGIFDGNVPLMDTPLDRITPLFDELFRVNVLGNILIARLFKDMLEATEGALVLTASTAAYAADGGGLMYSATKGAVRSIVNQLAYEFHPSIRVNGVAPSGIANSQLRGPEALGMENQKQSDIPKEDFLSKFRSLMLLKELPTPEQHGPLYAFLASRHNKIMTGQTVIVDQGLFNRPVLNS